jgi:hypothetical protein
VTVTLAHGSGIDDLLMFGIPVVIAVIALRVAEKRAKQRMDGETGDDPEQTGPSV